MNQNLPPNQPGQPGGYPDEQGQSGNPYYSAQGGGEIPDLDASAPQLQTEDSQRINRKAIFFLGGIVLLLILMTVLVLSRGGEEEEDKPAEKPREDKVVIPKLPEAPPEPIPLEAPPPPPPQELPPLPPEEPMADEGRRGGGGGGGGDSGPSGPTLMERRMGQDGGGGGSSYPYDAGGGGGGGEGGEPFAEGGEGGGAAAGGRAKRERTKLASFINGPDSLLVRGTYIRCILETRIITDYPGFASCIVTEPVYSINGRNLLLPKGTKVSGTYQGAPFGPRMAVVWDRITTPNGIDVSIASPGVDNLGSAGHPGDYNGHWAAKISSALMISLISDAFKYAAAKNGPPTTTVTDGGTVIEQPFESNTAKTVERLAQDALNKAMARPPTVTINQGTMLNIYVAEDVDFSAVVGGRR